MREILFMGKRKDNGEWVVGHYCKSFGRVNGKTYDYHVIYNLISGRHYQIIPETLGQYTGLTDENGTKIFEGDVVETYEDYDDTFGYPATDVFRSLVIWDESNCCFAIKTGDYIQPFNDWDWDYTTKIGNIHDNPELLGGGEEHAAD